MKSNSRYICEASPSERLAFNCFGAVLFSTFLGKAIKISVDFVLPLCVWKLKPSLLINGMKDDACK